MSQEGGHSTSLPKVQEHPQAWDWAPKGPGKGSGDSGAWGCPSLAPQWSGLITCQVPGAGSPGWVTGRYREAEG